MVRNLERNWNEDPRSQKRHILGGIDYPRLSKGLYIQTQEAGEMIRLAEGMVIKEKVKMSLANLF